MDVGEYGLGFSASELRSPDGCRGTTYFIDLITNDMAGSGQAIKNGICVYEEDAGILWRKMHTITGYRTHLKNLIKKIFSRNLENH